MCAHRHSYAGNQMRKPTQTVTTMAAMRSVMARRCSCSKEHVRSVGVSKGTERTCKYRDVFAAVFVAGIRGQQLVEKRHGDIMLR